MGMAMFPLAFAMIGEEFPPAKVAAAQGIISAMFAGGAALGLFGGAYLTERFGWQFTYHTVGPFSFAILILTAVVLVESRNRLQAPLDIPGAALLGGALATGLVAISQGPVWGWGNLYGAGYTGVPLGVPELFGLALALTIGFLLWEPRTPTPIVDFARLKERNIWIANVIAVTAGMAMFLVFVTNSIFAQLRYVGLNQTVLEFGYLSLPTAITMMLLGPFIGLGVGKYGPRPIMILGSLVVAGGGLLLAAFHATPLELALATIPAIVGVIALFIAMTNVIVLSSERRETGIQTGMNATFRTLGQSLGPVVATTVILSFRSPVTVLVAWAPRRPPVPMTFLLPSAAGFEYVYLIAAALGLASAALSAFLINYKIRADGSRTNEPARAPAAPVATPTAAPVVSPP
jgi:MFS family permease